MKKIAAIAAIAALATAFGIPAVGTASAATKDPINRAEKICVNLGADDHWQAGADTNGAVCTWFPGVFLHVHIVQSVQDEKEEISHLSERSPYEIRIVTIKNERIILGEDNFTGPDLDYIERLLKKMS